MKVGFSTPNAAGTGPVAQSAILTPANSVNGNAVKGSVLLSSGVPTLPQTAAPTAGPYATRRINVIRRFDANGPSLNKCFPVAFLALRHSQMLQLRQ
ncbi:MAG: hypothetical protein ACJ0RB_01085 [Candidatus Azotimanducaceae bacterium]